jgi:DNA helicase-2/ATP-dependent DNA helicase PcrA
VRTLFGTTRYLAPSRFLADLPEEVVELEGSTSRRSFGASRRGFGSAGESPRAFRRPRLAPGERFVDRSAFDDRPADDEHAIGMRPGDRVRHRSFGEGVVESIEQNAAEPTIVARFPGRGSVRIRAAYLARS